MASKLTMLILATGSYLTLGTTFALGAEIQCPDTITETPSVSVIAGPWTIAAKSGERSLEQAGIYLGTASEYGAQVPDSTTKAGLRETVTWNLIESPADSFWAGCSYVGTTAILLKKLEPGTKRCMAIYELLPSGKRQRLSKFECQ